MKKISAFLMPIILTVTQNPLIGRARKSFANNVFTTYKGLNVVKSKPLSVANPDSDKQKVYRAAQKMIVELYRAASAVIKLGFQQTANPLSPYNAFVSYNRLNAFDYSTPPTPSWLTDLLLFAKGSMTSTEMTSVVLDESDGTATFAWNTAALDASQNANDTLNVVIISNQDYSVKHAVATAIKRSAGTASLNVVGIEEGEDYNVYTFFASSTEKKSSDSVFKNVTAIA
jgi:hypothetical protein